MSADSGIDCVGCGLPIPLKRLLAMPLAELCVDCQTRQDVPPIRPEQIPEAMADVEMEADQIWGQ